MEGLLVLAALAIPVLAVAGFFMALGARDRLRRLEQTVRMLEDRIAVGASLAPRSPEPMPETARPPRPEAETISTPEPEPALAPAGIESAPELPTPVPSPPAPARTAPPVAGGFEERFGTRWVVWVGGLALALGGVFLVRYSIEKGLIGPGLRVSLGALLAVLLAAAGEWTRRKENLSGVAGVHAAHIPSILTAAGTTVAFATVYAAFALYGFLPPPVAFVALGAVALAALAAALLHGPALAGLGLVGAYVTPLLVASEQPNFWALYIYLAVVTAAAFALARARLWRWLAVTAIALSVAWISPGIAGIAIEAHAFHALAGLALVAIFIVAGLYLGPPALPGRLDVVSSVAIAVYVFSAAHLVIANQHDAVTLIAFSAMVAGAAAIAWRTDAAAGAVPAAAACVALVMGHWAVAFPTETLVAPTVGDTRALGEGTGLHLALGAAYAALFGFAGYLAQGRSERAVAPLLWAATAAAAPLAVVIALYYKTAGFAQSFPFAGVALLIAALFAVATETLVRRTPRPGVAGASAIFAVGAIAALALALTLALEKGWLTVALALTVPGAAYVGNRRPLPQLRWTAAVMAAVVVGRLIYEPRVVGEDVGGTFIFNWLLWGYGVPALAFWLGGRLLRQRGDDAPTRMVEAAAILFTVLTVFLQIRHIMNDGDIYRGAAGLAELSLQVCAALALAIGLEWIRERSRSLVHNIAALIMAAFAFWTIVIGLAFTANPLFVGERVGGLFFNLVLLGYGIPAVLSGVLALMTRATRPMPYRIVAAGTSVGLAVLYLSLEVRRIYQGPDLMSGVTSNAEQYTYSVVWLAFGVILLLAGVWLRSQPARLASAAVVLLTIAKVFLVDLSDLEDVYQSISFVGLGLVLLGIGWVYQRLLFRRPPPAAAASDAVQAT